MLPNGNQPNQPLQQDGRKIPNDPCLQLPKGK